MAKKKILVTGASGFVGKYLVDSLIAEYGSNISIVAVYNKNLELPTRPYISGVIKWVKLDITQDDLTGHFAGVDTVYHLAGFFSLGETRGDINRLDRINVVGSKRVVAESLKSGVKNFIYVSSISVCELNNSKFLTLYSKSSTNEYGKSKKRAEDLILNLASENFRVTILRPSALFGEGHLGSVFELVKIISLGRMIIFGSGNNNVNFYYIRDFIDALIAADVRSTEYRRVYNCTDNSYTLNDLCNYISLGLNKKSRVLKVPKIIGLICAIIFDFMSLITNKSFPLSVRRYYAMTSDIKYSNLELQSDLKLQISYGSYVGILRTVKWFKDEGLV